MDRVLRDAEFVEGRALSDAHLRLDEVDVGDFLGHGVLDLDAGVHLDEDVLSSALPHGVNEELNGSGVLVADCTSELDRIRAQGCLDSGIKVRCGRDLDDLLVASLHRAVAFVQVDHVAVAVRKNLDFNVAWSQHRLLEEHCGVTECGIGLTHCGLKGLTQVLAALHAAHASATTTCNSLGKDREPDPVGLLHEVLDVTRRLG